MLSQSKKRMAKPKLIGHKWRFSEIWNEALHTLPERPLVKRQHIWASELGQSKIDRYLKMNAHPFSNPPNDRSLRKFSAGHIWEWILGFVLTSTGILKEKQLRGEVELPGLLRVTGKLDFVAGGFVDWDKARADITQMQKLFSASIGDMPPIIFHAAANIINTMQKKYGANPLEEIILEVKSVSSYMSEKIQKTGLPMPHHVLQNLHYVIANKLPGAVNYICKDDCIVSEFSVLPSKPLLKLYHDDVRAMTELINNTGKNYLKNIPEKEPEANFVLGLFRFEKNFMVEYSPYLTYVYNYKTPEDFRLKWQKDISSWNRTFKRVVTGAKMTPLNLSVISEVKKVFPEFDLYVEKAKKSGVFDVAEDDD